MVVRATRNNPDRRHMRHPDLSTLQAWRQARRLTPDEADETTVGRRKSEGEKTMQEVIYAMQFSGLATPTEGAPNVLKAATAAPSCSITTCVGPEGMVSTLQRVAGDSATFQSEVTFADDGSFQETGTIAFGGDGHLLRFSTVGQGYLGAAPDSVRKHGTVMWRVDGGEGQFAGAQGLITSNFFVGEAGEVTDHHFGVIFVQ